MQASLTRIETFSAAHRLNSTVLNEQDNRKLYGKCNNPNGHGHNYRLEVTLTGTVSTLRSGLLILAD